MESFKKYTTVFILLFINFIFTYKYTIRITNLAGLLSLGLLTLQIAVYIFQEKKTISKSNLKKGFLAIGVLWFLLVLITHYKIALESLNVDRWSVISSFIEECLKGNYPYYAKSHSGSVPGPMPFYFLLASPFYFIGELALFSYIGYAVITVLLVKRSDNMKHANFMLFYLLTSVYVLWELVVRSNIFTNAALILLAFIYLEDFDFRYSWKFWLMAFLTGFMLSTRSVFILPYTIFFLSYLLNKKVKFSKLVQFLLLAVAGFSLTFLPLVTFFKEDFLKINPFIVESTFLIPMGYTVFFIVLALGLSFLVKSSEDRFFYSGLSLFLSILIYSIYHLVKVGFQAAYIDSLIDISYFILCVPFLIYYLSGAKSVSAAKISKS